MEQDNNTNGTGGDSSEPKPRKTFFGMIRRHPRTAALLTGIVLVGGLFGWQSLSHRHQIRAVQTEAELSQTALCQEMLLLVAKPMVWSLKQELIPGNIAQTQLMLDEVVRGGKFIFIHVVDTQGKIAASTDRSMVGKPADSLAYDTALASEVPLCTPDGDSRMLVSSPIMGLDRRIATLIFAYQCSSK